MPTSFDPYVAYGVHLFVDFLFTESLTRLVLVLVWTGMGVILADIALALWIDVGMPRKWRRLHRDLYVMFRSMPSVPFLRARTIRFSLSRTTSTISSPPSIFATNTQHPASRLAGPIPSPLRRFVPGAFFDNISETQTDIGSLLGLRVPSSESSTGRLVTDLTLIQEWKRRLQQARITPMTQTSLPLPSIFPTGHWICLQPIHPRFQMVRKNSWWRQRNVKSPIM